MQPAGYQYLKSQYEIYPQVIGQLVNLLTALESDVGLIISERIINMPPQIAVPLYQTLANEVKKAKNKNLPFGINFAFAFFKTLR